MAPLGFDIDFPDKGWVALRFDAGIVLLPHEYRAWTLHTGGDKEWASTHPRSLRRPMLPLIYGESRRESIYGAAGRAPVFLGRRDLFRPYDVV